VLRSAGRGSRQGCVADRAVNSGPVDGSSVGSCAADAGAVCRSASRGCAAAGREMTHASPCPLTLTHFCRLRFGRIQRVRVDVRRPHGRRQTQCSRDHYQTKTAHSQFGHLGLFPHIVPQLPQLSGFPIYSDARSVPVASSGRQRPPSPRYYGTYTISGNNKVFIAQNCNFDLTHYGTST
jgi:hypothetical protein